MEWKNITDFAKTLQPNSPINSTIAGILYFIASILASNRIDILYELADHAKDCSERACKDFKSNKFIDIDEEWPQNIE